MRIEIWRGGRIRWSWLWENNDFCISAWLGKEVEYPVCFSGGIYEQDLVHIIEHAFSRFWKYCMIL